MQTNTDGQPNYLQPSLYIIREMISRGHSSVPCSTFNNILYKQKVKKSEKINKKNIYNILFYY
jgi:hypothetical protein